MKMIQKFALIQEIELNYFENSRWLQQPAFIYAGENV